MVFQHFNLFPNMSALDNVVLAQVHGLGRSKDQARDRATDLLTRVGLASAMNRRPAELSGGQQQRVAIARALALDPDALLLDEPTSSIDPELRVEVRSVISELAQSGVTMVVVTHELDFVSRVATRVAFMADGTVIEQGQARTVLEQPEHERTKQFIAAVRG
jgi:ABC-type polar amino acid transport system ATPase subunit